MIVVLEGKSVRFFVVEVMDGLCVFGAELGTSVQKVVTTPSDGAIVLCVVCERLSELGGCCNLVNFLVEEGSVHVSHDILDDTLLCAVLLMCAGSAGCAEVEEAFANSLIGNCVFALHGCVVRCRRGHDPSPRG